MTFNPDGSWTPTPDDPIVQDLIWPPAVRPFCPATGSLHMWRWPTVVDGVTRLDVQHCTHCRATRPA